MNAYRVLGVLGVLLALASSVSAELVSNSGLIAYYSFDNAANLGLDGSVNHYDGTVVNPLTGPATLAYAVDGVRGSVARFTNATTGSATGFIDLPSAAIVAAGKSPTSNFTLAAWVNYQPNTAQEIFSARTLIGTTATMCIHTELRPDQTPSNYRFVLREGGAGTTILDMNTKDVIAPVADAWHHVAMTYDKLATVDQMKIYIDGTLSKPASPSSPQDIAPWNNGARIGATVDNASRPFVGMMDELYLFNRTLTLEEVRDVGISGVVPEPGCLTLWTLALITGGGYGIWRRKRRVAPAPL